VIGFYGIVAYCSKTCRAAGTSSSMMRRVDRRPVGADLDRRRAERRRTGEERSGGVGVAAGRHENVDDLPELIDRPVQVRPPAGNLPEVSSTNHLSPLAEQFLDIAVGQPVAQVPAHRDRDHLPREPVTRRC
jgi:hypothetical protein